MKKFVKADVVHQPFLFFHSLFVLPVIFLANLWQLVLIFFIYLGLNIYLNKKIPIIRFILFFISILLLNLYMPKGQVLFRFLGFPFTQDAFIEALYRAFLFNTLILFSSFTLSYPLRIKGSFGQILHDSLEFMNLLFVRIKINEKPKNMYQFIDQKIMNAWQATQDRTQNENEPYEMSFEFLLYFYIIILLWSLVIISSLKSFHI